MNVHRSVAYNRVVESTPGSVSSAHCCIILALHRRLLYLSLFKFCRFARLAFYRRMSFAALQSSSSRFSAPADL